MSDHKLMALDRELQFKHGFPLKDVPAEIPGVISDFSTCPFVSLADGVGLRSLHVERPRARRRRVLSDVLEEDEPDASDGAGHRHPAGAPRVRASHTKVLGYHDRRQDADLRSRSKERADHHERQRERDLPSGVVPRAAGQHRLVGAMIGGG